MDTTTPTAVADAPVSTPSAPSGDASAPAITPSTSAPARPASMKEAFAQTQAKRTAGSEGPATIVPPATPDGSPAAKRGPIPFDVHETTLKNAREKAVAEYQAKYGWAEQIPEQEFRQALAIAQRVSADPVAHLQELIAELQAHPQHGATLRSLAAKALAAGRGQAPATMPEPDVAITDATGAVVGQTYSAKQLAARDAFLQAAWMAKVEDRIRPAIQTHETLAKQQQAAIDKAAGDSFASGLMGELKTYAHFEAHKDAIGQEVVRMLAKYPKDDPRLNHPAFLEATTLRAYQTVVGPKRQALDQAAAVASLKQKAVAQVEQASATTPSSTTRPRNPKELAQFLEQKANARKAAR